MQSSDCLASFVVFVCYSATNLCTINSTFAHRWGAESYMSVLSWSVLQSPGAAFALEIQWNQIARRSASKHSRMFDFSASVVEWRHYTCQHWTKSLSARHLRIWPDWNKRLLFDTDFYSDIYTCVDKISRNANKLANFAFYHSISDESGSHAIVSCAAAWW